MPTDRWVGRSPRSETGIAGEHRPSVTTRRKAAGFPTGARSSFRPAFTAMDPATVDREARTNQGPGNARSLMRRFPTNLRSPRRAPKVLYVADLRFFGGGGGVILQDIEDRCRET